MCYPYKRIHTKPAHTALICSYEYNNVDQATHVLSLLTNGVQDVLPRLSTYHSTATPNYQDLKTVAAVPSPIHFVHNVIDTCAFPPHCHV